MKRAGIVLCGGLSRRMGRPKALLPWFGRTMIEHVVASLAPCVDELLVVTSRDVLLPPLVPAARIVFDREPGRGPLAALRDGLAAARSELAFVTASDAPFLDAAYVTGLFEQAEGQGGAAAPTAGGHLQVLSAVYPCRAWRTADGVLSEGKESPWALLERLGVRSDANGTSDEVGPWTGFNTPDEYLALARRRDPAATAVVEWRGARAVAIGRLGEVLRAATPPGASFDDGSATSGLRVRLAETELSIEADAELPIGPGDRVVVAEAPLAGPSGDGSPPRARR